MCWARLEENNWLKQPVSQVLFAKVDLRDSINTGA